jgi:hypothetical protein
MSKLWDIVYKDISLGGHVNIFISRITWPASCLHVLLPKVNRKLSTHKLYDKDGNIVLILSLHKGLKQLLPL